MDSFEQIVGKLLEEDSYWIRHSVKVDLSKDEKRLIGKPSAPRPEIDIVALDAVSNTLLLIEVKSYLDSAGVRADQVKTNTEVQIGRYKLLTSSNYRSVIEERLVADWTIKGIIKEKPTVKYGLVAGKVYQNKEKELKEYFKMREWFFWGPSDVKEKVRLLADKGYENHPVTISVKILKNN